MFYRYGLVLFTVLYFGSGLFGALFTSATSYCQRGIGASVAGFGLFGVELAQMLVCWHLLANRKRVLIGLVLLCFLFLIMSLLMNIGHMAHLGGCTGGFLIGILYEINMENKPNWYTTGKWASIIALVGVAAISAVGTFVIPRGCGV
eukprot:GHVS01097585.1.p2 GENE.GHVS01097585.1~~GHVS01097585.1.p2  ORF type:complete len:147 (-),score=19.70 GHVS01097585.1:255-695(-)